MNYEEELKEKSFKITPAGKELVCLSDAIAIVKQAVEQAETAGRAGKEISVEDGLERFIRNERKICWEAEYQNGEYCIGENKVREFFNRISQLKEGK